MRCPSCQAELAGEPKYCSECGGRVKSGAPAQSTSSGPEFTLPEDLTGADVRALKTPSGFSRTLSTELVARQMELRALVMLSTLIQSRTYQPGEVLIRKGDTHRDLFFLTQGRIEISRQEGDGNLVLNEIDPPYILGEIAFLFGTPRTATATAVSEVKTFILKYEDLTELLKELPPWLAPLLTALSSAMKSLHHKAKVSQQRLLELEQQSRLRT